MSELQECVALRQAVSGSAASERCDMRHRRLMRGEPELFSRVLNSSVVRVDPSVRRLEGVRIVGIDFEGSDLRGIAFRKCVMVDCVFDRCQLEGMRTFGTTWDDCTFRGACLDDAQLAVIDEGRDPHFRRCRFDGAKMDVDVGEGIFEDCSFLDVRMRKVDWSGAVFRRCQFGGTLKDCVFRICDEQSVARGWTLVNGLQNCDFSQATLSDCEFRGIRVAKEQLPKQGHLIIENWPSWLPRALAALDGDASPAGQQALEGLLVVQKTWESRDILTAVFWERDLAEIFGAQGAGVIRTLARAAL